MTDFYRIAAIQSDIEGQAPDASELAAAQVHAILAVADELRSLRLLIEGLTGKAGSNAFLRVFDEAPK